MSDAIKVLDSERRIVDRRSYDYKDCPLAEITELKDEHVRESIKILEKHNEEEHEKMKNQINEVKIELGDKIDKTSSSIKETIETTLNRNTDKKIVKIVRWSGSIVFLALAFVFKEKLIELFQGWIS